MSKYDYWGQPIDDVENKPCKGCGLPIKFGNYCHYCIEKGIPKEKEEKERNRY